ncbi:putative Sperm-associated antigen 1 [Hypsibius exemplaris]|uniref:Sperm-associated antigen 1 n=1 Tax=Hypsibius exemplaris TaxID=2072580 RepID=A0A1W0WGY8_HYPEX|nr:putative Sperm-associated antigen 1 [Hypsibius exemplaris]
MGLNLPEKMPSESPLLEAYQLLVEDLDYGAIGKCTDVAMLVKILRVLRSAQVGYYPDLIEFTEERIRMLNPKHIILTKDDNVWSREDVGESGDAQALDLTDLCRSTASLGLDHIPDLEPSCSGTNCDEVVMYPIRKRAAMHCEPLKNESDLNAAKRKNETEQPSDCSHGHPKNKRIKSSDFTSWDKYDVHAELLKIDEKHDEEKRDRVTGCHGLAEFVRIDDKATSEKEPIALREKEKGNEAYRAGDYNEALSYFNRSLSVQMSLVVINNRAQVYIKLKKFAEAVSDLKYILSNDSQNVKALLRLGTIYAEQKEPEKAVQYFKSASQLCPESKVAARMLERLTEQAPTTTRDEAGPVWRCSAKKKGPLIEVIE